jgi:23S rRNA pseudouridine2605 synthase
MLLRLQKVLAQAGLASRRQAEEWIAAGRIAVNGQMVTALGTQADPDVDRIAVDGRLIRPSTPKVYYVLNKPRGYVSTCEDERGRPTVLDLLKPLKCRLFPVGRLDWDTEGVLLLTNDGELAQRLLHPRYQMRRTYLAKVDGIPTPETLQRLVQRGHAPDERGHPPTARLVKAGERHACIEVDLWEGKNRQVRRMCDAIGHPVRRLRRVQFAGLDADGLESGQFRRLKPAEILALKRRTGLEQGRVRPG